MRKFIQIVEKSSLNEWNPLAKKQAPWTPERERGTLSQRDINRLKGEVSTLISTYGINVEKFMEILQNFDDGDVRHFAQFAPKK